MSGIWVCATGQGRFFTSKNPEQAPNFEVLLQNKPYLLEFYSRTGSFFDNLVSNAWLKCQNPSCFQLCFLQPDVFTSVLLYLNRCFKLSVTRISLSQDNVFLFEFNMILPLWITFNILRSSEMNKEY